eukprot:scaffold15929_cov159-Ochromonas_danica.AAC.1
MDRLQELKRNAPAAAEDIGVDIENDKGGSLSCPLFIFLWLLWSGEEAAAVLFQLSGSLTTVD